MDGHVAPFPDDDPAYQILSVREPHEWRRPTDRPRASWLQQVDRHLKMMGLGQAPAWGMARQKPLEYRRKVYATFCIFLLPMLLSMHSVHAASFHDLHTKSRSPHGTTPTFSSLLVMEAHHMLPATGNSTVSAPSSKSLVTSASSPAHPPT